MKEATHEIFALLAVRDRGDETKETRHRLRKLVIEQLRRHSGGEQKLDARTAEILAGAIARVDEEEAVEWLLPEKLQRHVPKKSRGAEACRIACVEFVWAARAGWLQMCRPTGRPPSRGASSSAMGSARS